MVESIPKSVDFMRYLLVGLKNGNITEYDIRKNGKEVIMRSHCDGEVWGLCVIPNQNKFVTSGDDNKLLLYDVPTRKLIATGQVIVDDPNA